MDSSQDVELLSKAIEKLLEEKRKRDAADDTLLEDDDDQLLLSRLLSQLESAKGDGTLKQPEGSAEEDTVAPPITVHGEDGRSENQKDEVSTEEIVKEIRHMKRQNTITHLLLSGMILLTLAWQLSEFSVILKVKDRLSHPFRSFGNVLVGMLKGNAPPNEQLPEKLTSISKEERNNYNHNYIEVPSLPSLKIPDLLQELGLNDDE